MTVTYLQGILPSVADAQSFCPPNSADNKECGKRDRDRFSPHAGVGWPCCQGECCSRRCRKRLKRRSKLIACFEDVQRRCNACNKSITELWEANLEAEQIETTQLGYAEGISTQEAIAAKFYSEAAPYEADEAAYLSQAAAYGAKTAQQADKQKTQQVLIVAGAAVAGLGLAYALRTNKKRKKR